MKKLRTKIRRNEAKNNRTKRTEQKNTQLDWSKFVEKHS
jgi:hypothetical protein